MTVVCTALSSHPMSRSRVSQPLSARPPATNTVSQHPSGNTTGTGVTWSQLIQKNTIKPITATKLAEVVGAESITAEQLATEAVTAPKTKIATKPAAGAEDTVTLGTAGVTRRIVAVFVGNGSETKAKVPHNLNTIIATAIATKGGATHEQPATALGKWTNNSVNEGTYTFTTPPLAGEEIFIAISG